MEKAEKPKMDFERATIELYRLLRRATPDQKYIILGFVRNILGGRGNG